MPQHHEVFSRFKLFGGKLPGGYDLDSFLGTINRLEFVKEVTRREGPLEVYYPNFDNEYFEWIDILESVIAAKRSYTMIELGAGYGRWAVRAGFAVRQYNRSLPFHLIAVEAEPVHFEWMGLHFQDNQIDTTHHRLIHAAVSDTEGEVLFSIGGPRGGAFDHSPNAWYGQSLTKDHDLLGRSEECGEYSGYKVTCHESGWRSITVPSVSLAAILEGLGQVDLIDMDIEGHELRAIRSAIKRLNTQVKRLHIGTHGKDIEVGLRQTFSAHGWRCLTDFSLLSSSETPWGTISFDNGVQSWLNPRF